MKNPILIFSIFIVGLIRAQQMPSNGESFKINDQEYLEKRGANGMLAHDFYPESHQGGVGIIQNGIRVATNGDLRLEPAQGQWQPVPKVGKRMVNRKKQEISVAMSYPDETKNGIRPWGRHHGLPLFGIGRRSVVGNKINGISDAQKINNHM